ncbi:MAG TPA: thiamine pyrophosphate-binding protein [Ilumatobacteraceae bacterium]|nr:thiamine pyrophosphate-binding protein [Ilumatobacteraceae bacterium]
MITTGGEAVVAALEALGVRHVFGIVSVHNLPIVDAIGRSAQVRFVETRHEQGAAHCADGYARATGELGVALTSTGPGAANAMGGLLEANHASSRVLMITGQSETRWYGKGRSTIHETDQQLDMLRTVTRHCAHVEHHSDIYAAILRAARDICSGRPRPGAVEIPVDLQYAKGELEPVAVRPPVRPSPDAALVGRAGELLAAAGRPLIWAGGGVVSAGAAGPVVELAERLGAPVLTSVEGRGAIPEDHPLALGANGDLSAFDQVIADADVVLAVGTRFQLASNLQIGLSIPGTLIHIDADPGVIDRFHPVDLGIRADAEIGLTALLGDLGGRDVRGAESPYVERATAAREQVIADGLSAMGDDHASIMQTVRDNIGRDAIVVKDSTVAGIVWANRHLQVYEPRTSMRPVSAAIGPGLPLAIGASVGTGRRTVLIQGDGGFMLSIGELATAVQERLPIITCVFNDRGYGILRYIQDTAFAGRRTAVDLHTPDFAALARSMGMASAAVSSADEFATAFSEAVATDEPWLIDIDLTALAPMRIVPQSPSQRGRRAR